ncbi:MAG: DegT/DnrJ/EryC1/StrS family aminotransferase [Phycisphaerae bacterium]|nr:DegT/DnrJ/EryC1/StrS family aminotransferase [Phycisphaerae bacterium]
MPQSSDTPVPLASPDVTETEIQAVVAVLQSDRLSLGPRTVSFEQACARRAGRRHGIAVNSGTSGLHLCVRALELAEGDEVITPSFSFVATTNCLLFERVRPVFVDIDPDSYNMDPAAVAAAVTSRTRAILPVEVFGNTAHFDQYEQLARAHGLAMIEDSCEALGGALGGRSAGGFGQCGVFAFYPNKQITTGEGGMIVTDDDVLADRCRSMRNQGRDSAAWLSHARLGYNYRMSEINAAIGEIQMARLDEILAKRRDVAQRYHRCLGDIAEIHLPPMADPAHASWFVYVIRLNDRFSAADRDRVMEHLAHEGVGCNKYFVPIHHQPYVKPWVGDGVHLPHTERVAARTIALPFFNHLTDAQMRRVKVCLQDALRRVTPRVFTG